MAAHSSILAYRIPRTKEPGELKSMGSQSQTQLKQLSTHGELMIHHSQCRGEKAFEQHEGGGGIFQAVFKHWKMESVWSTLQSLAVVHMSTFV